MKNNRRFLAHSICLVLGLILGMLGTAGLVDEYWSALGATLVTVGIVRLVREYRLRKDAGFREAVEVQTKDERVSFIRNKAWAWTGTSMIMIAAVLSIVFRVMGENLLCTATGGMVCLMVLLYWGFYFILQRKY